MNVKVQCPCGARFAFDVEPVHDRMPVPINCPECGADATNLSNAVIRQQAGPSIPSKPRVIARNIRASSHSDASSHNASATPSWSS